jgi:hypothetical protein
VFNTRVIRIADNDVEAVARKVNTEQITESRSATRIRLTDVVGLAMIGDAGNRSLV